MGKDPDDAGSRGHRKPDVRTDTVEDNDAQRWFKSEALKLSEDVLENALADAWQQGGQVATLPLVVVIFWLTVTFAELRPLRAGSNASVHLASLFVAAISVKAAISPDPLNRRPL